MTFPRLPEWLVYGAVVAALVLAALGRRENADAPEAPPPPTREEGALLAPVSGFEHTIAVKTATGPFQPTSGTAFSISDHGLWLTARHVVGGCAHIALMEGAGRGAEAKLLPEDAGGAPSDVAVLSTEGGSPSLPLRSGAGLRIGERSFHPGFPRGAAGEATSRLLGRQMLAVRGRGLGGAAGARGIKPEPVLAWAEAGRTDKLGGDLAGLSGAPALDAHGQVVGVTLAEAPRRGRIYTSSPDAIREALSRAHVVPTQAQPSEPVTVENYGRVADSLRRDLRVAQVMCLGA